MRSRSYGRALALQAVYCTTVSAVPLEELLNFQWWDNFSLPIGREQRGPIQIFAADLVRGVLHNSSAIDSALSTSLEHWDIERVLIVDRSLLRIGSYEILYLPEIPHKVTINEIVELAKRYGDTNSPAFVNGVLDAVQRTQQTQ